MKCIECSFFYRTEEDERARCQCSSEWEAPCEWEEEEVSDDPEIWEDEDDE